MSNSPNGNLSSHEEQRLLIKDTVKETLLTLGLDISDPIKMQKDFQHLREWRETTEAVWQKGTFTIIAMLIAGFVSALWIGIKTQLGLK